jgi:hypothetical protein
MPDNDEVDWAEESLFHVEGEDKRHLVTIRCEEGRIGVWYTTYTELRPVMQTVAMNPRRIKIKMLEPASKFVVDGTR